MTKPVQVKPVKAYAVSTNDPEESTIEFATTNVAARRQGADEIGADFSWVSCKRAPWADEFAGKGIPAKAYIENGWFIGCTHCGRYISEDAYELDEHGDETETPLNPVFDGRDVYCSDEHKAAFEQQIADHNAAFEAFKAKVITGWPDLTFTEFKGAYPLVHCTALFTFPGAAYPGHIAERDGELRRYVAREDEAAWAEYERQRAA